MNKAPTWKINGRRTRAECMQLCKDSVAGNGRPCMAIEMRTDKGPNKIEKCLMTWACDGTEDDEESDVYIMPTGLWTTKFVEVKRTCDSTWTADWNAKTEEECKQACLDDHDCAAAFLITDASVEDRCLLMDKCEEFRPAKNEGTTWVLNRHLEDEH